MDGKEGKRSQDINRGDFNTRSGEEGGKIEEEEWEGSKYRRSKDRKINGERKRLINCIRERDSILRTNIN